MKETLEIYQVIFQQKLCRPEETARYLQSVEGKNTCNQTYSTWQDHHSELKERAVPRQTEVKEFITSKMAL